MKRFHKRRASRRSGHGGRKFKKFAGFGVATAGQGMRVLFRASMDAEDGHCGKALEALGKAKVLLGKHIHKGEAARLAKEVERGCPKRELVLRSDVVELMGGSGESLLPSNWERSKQMFQHRKLEKPTAKTIWFPGQGELVVPPTKAEIKAWEDLVERRKLVHIAERGRHGQPSKRGRGYKRKEGKLTPIRHKRGRRTAASEALIASMRRAMKIPPGARRR